MARKFTAAERKAIAVRMKAYWAKKRKEQSQPFVATPQPTAPRMAVRVIADNVIQTHAINTYGELVDLLMGTYGTTPLDEVLITVQKG